MLLQYFTAIHHNSLYHHYNKQHFKVSKDTEVITVTQLTLNEYSKFFFSVCNLVQLDNHGGRQNQYCQFRQQSYFSMSLS